MLRLIFLVSIGVATTVGEECKAPELEHGLVRGEGDGKSWVGSLHCLPGYSLVGSPRLKCRAGQWSSAHPACTAPGGTCDPAALPAIAHGRAKPYHTSRFRGSVYKYSCKRGYSKLGHSLVHCGGAGQWDTSRAPVCYKAGCSEEGLGSLPGGRALRRAEGGIYQYRCRSGAELVGAATLVCDGRVWNGSRPECRFPPDTLTIAGPESVQAGQEVVVECRAGEANPAPVLEWELNHAGLPGQVVDSVLAGQGEGAGWLASSAATWQADRVPQYAVRCRAGSLASPLHTIAVVFPAEGVAVSGPAEARAGERVQLTCRAGPASPPASLTWSAAGQVETGLEAGGRAVSTISLVLPTTGLVVECRAGGDPAITASHQVQVAATTSTSTSTTSYSSRQWEETSSEEDLASLQFSTEFFGSNEIPSYEEERGGKVIEDAVYEPYTEDEEYPTYTEEYITEQAEEVDATREEETAADEEDVREETESTEVEAATEGREVSEGPRDAVALPSGQPSQQTVGSSSLSVTEADPPDPNTGPVQSSHTASLAPATRFTALSLVLTAAAAKLCSY